jgi:hypothetical protein
VDVAKLFDDLYRASTEKALEVVLDRYPMLQSADHWRPYGRIESNYGVVENQQASPIPALCEKLTNATDAILMRRCVEEGIDPRSASAPRSMEEAVERFFPNAASWNQSSFRKDQAENIQVIARGPKMDTSLVIYDNGEGQRPENFEDTFLSLLAGNKNEIHFVQGKYNMGGAGAIAFCGKNRYQLIGSKRFDGTGNFGFTLLRRHPLSTTERVSKKNTWYEYLSIDGIIPSFPITELDLGLFKRKFKTGTIIKLYSYDLPSGSRSVISRDLNQSLNEFLFSPALPIYTVDTKERYPDDRNPQRDLYGLKRRLEEDESRYVGEFFSEDIVEHGVGRAKVTCYVFRTKIEDKTAAESKDSIRREFFKNDMSVVFSVHGQVHGHYTAEFITRSLKFPLLRDYLLIHVDCTDLKLEYRNELFMASRDRVKDGEESRALRKRLAQVLVKGRLKDIYEERKSSITVESKDAEDLLKSFTKNLPLQSDLMRLLGQTFKLEANKDGGAPDKKKRQPTNTESTNDERVFLPKRFPSFFKIHSKSDNGIPVVTVPLGGERTIKFSTDVEDQYFDRVDDPGQLQIAILGIDANTANGGTKPGLPRKPGELLNVVTSSPHKGTIRVAVNPTEDVKVGDAITIRAQLSGESAAFSELVLLKITEPEKKQDKKTDGIDDPDSTLGLPRLTLVYENEVKTGSTWAQLDEQGITIDSSVVMHPYVEGDKLAAIYVNMDSTVLLNYRAKLSTPETISVAERRYISSVYFHALFLYMITKNRKYGIVRPDDGDGKDKHVDVTEYLRDLFQSSYAEFLLNFEIQALMTALE